METLFDTTITDKPTYTPSIIDTVKYGTLTNQEKMIFETLRNSMLEIFPIKKNDPTHDNESLRYAENFAFINLKVITINVNQIIDEKIAEINSRLTVLEGE